MSKYQSWAHLYALQFHPVYRLESDQWIRKIRFLGVENFIQSLDLFSEYFIKNKNLIDGWSAEFELWMTDKNSEGLKKILTCLDCDYPAAFWKIKNPPLIIFIKGHWNLTDRNFISVVGSRDIRPYSTDWLDENLMSFLKTNDVGVCSGGARGVDIKSHQICVRLKRPTLVLLPSGLEQIYPLELKVWEDSVIAHGGAFVSEYSPQTTIRKHFFHARNRLIAALGVFTLLVQSEKRSGSLITAHHCIEQGKALGVVPGHPYDSQFSGNLILMRDGALPIIDASDLKILFDSEMM